MKLLRLVHMYALYPQMENFLCNERIAYLFIYCFDASGVRQEEP